MTWTRFALPRDAFIKYNSNLGLVKGLPTSGVIFRGCKKFAPHLDLRHLLLEVLQFIAELCDNLYEFNILQDADLGEERADVGLTGCEA